MSLNSLSSDDAEDKVIVFERNATVPLLPWPDHWGHSTLNKKFLIATLICAVFLVISPFYTWSALGQGDLFKAAYGVMMVAAAAVFTAIAASSIRPRRASATLILVAEGGDSADGLRINASRGRAYMLWAFLSIGVAFFVVRGVMVLNLALGEQSGYSSSRIAINWIQIVLMFAFAGLFVWLLIGVRGANRSHLLLTPEAVTQKAGHLRTSLRWGDIVSATAVFPNDNPMIRVVAAKESDIDIDGTGILAWMTRKRHGYFDIPTTYAIDPALLLYVLDFYLRSPEVRSELDNPAAIDRISRGDLIK